MVRRMNLPVSSWTPINSLLKAITVEWRLAPIKATNLKWRVLRFQCRKGFFLTKQYQKPTCWIIVDRYKHERIKFRFPRHETINFGFTSIEIELVQRCRSPPWTWPPGTGPACRRWGFCLKIKIQTNLDVYRQLGSFSLSTQHVYFSTLIVWCWLQSAYNPRIADNFEHIKPLCLISSNKYVLVILFALKSISSFRIIVSLRSKFDVSNAISTGFHVLDSLRASPRRPARFWRFSCSWIRFDWLHGLHLF